MESNTVWWLVIDKKQDPYFVYMSYDGYVGEQNFDFSMLKWIRIR
jgi:hypothetical protein